MNIVNTDNTEHYQWGENSDGWHLLKSADLSIIEENVPPGEKEQRHYHNTSQQSGIHVPAKTPHQLMNNSSENLRFLVISQPMSHGDRVNA